MCLRREMGHTTRVSETRTGLHFTEGNLQVTVLDSSPIYINPVSTRHHTGDWVTVSTTFRHTFFPSAQPDAVLIAYRVIHQCDDNALLHTTAGRRELRAFVVSQLFPRLCHPHEEWSDEEEDTPSHVDRLFRYLHDVYIWLGHPPGHRWLQGSVSPAALAYLLQLWDHRGGTFLYMPNCWDGYMECSLRDLKRHLLARWHVEHSEGELGLLSHDGTHFHTLTQKIEQWLRLQHSPLLNPPRLCRCSRAGCDLSPYSPTDPPTYPHYCDFYFSHGGRSSPTLS